MNYLLDTHLLLWAAGQPEKLSAQALDLIESEDNTLIFSAASLWEVVIKNALGRPDFHVDANRLRRGLLDNGYTELQISSAHVLEVGKLPDHHRDPFDRILIAQANVEGVDLLTSDTILAKYGSVVKTV